MKSNESKKFWAYVAAFGALWGAIEITIGSFLHTLRIPFTGTFMASISAALLISQRQFISKRGISIATGAVAAICKSLSPYGIILGPMIGIFVESILIEIALIIAPKNLISAVFAGMLSALWATAQGLINQWIFYGTKLFELYIILIQKAKQMLRISTFSSWLILIIFISIICLSGATFAILGYFIGKKAFNKFNERMLEKRSF